MEDEQAFTTVKIKEPDLNHREAETSAAADEVNDDNNTLKMEDKEVSTAVKIEEPNHLEAAIAAAIKDEVNNDDEDDWKIQRDESKAAGDAAFRETDYTTAIHHYSAALSVDPDHAALLSNRSAAYLKSSQKSKALHDAQACVRIGTMGYKGHSRLAAALQSLGRYQQALDSWNVVVKQDPNNQAALKGVQDCQAAAEEKVAAEDEAFKEMAAAASASVEESFAARQGFSDEEDDLDDFFNGVDVVTSAVAKEKEDLAIEKPAVATNRIASHKKDLGTAANQIERLLQENYKWRNLNPFHVLDVPHTATSDDISRRFKALSLLLHPDKNRDNIEKAQEAYDQVLNAKAQLADDDKANHTRQLAEQGMLQGKSDWERRETSARKENLESFQTKAVQRIFAQVEYNRKEVEKRERNYKQRERQQEDDEVKKEKDARNFDKSWKVGERVDKRVGNWREFATKKKKKT